MSILSITKQLEQSEVTMYTSRLTALQERDENILGVEVKKFGNATAFSIKGLPGPSYNTVKGITDEEIPYIEEIIEFYREKGTRARFELVPELVSIDLFKKLSNFQLSQIDFHTTLYRDLSPIVEDKFEEHIHITPLTEENFHVFGEVYVKGFGMPLSFKDGVTINNQVLLRKKGWRFYLATIESKPIGIGVLHLENDFATLAAATTVPEYRKNGAHTRLIKERIMEAERNNAKLLITQTKFGSASHDNMYKQGFQVAYTKAIWSN